MVYDLLESMITAAMNAGNYVRYCYENRDFSVSEKRDSHDLVTDADRESQRIIIAQLKDRFPDIPVVAEEDDDISKEEHAFFIDPIDGTLNFVKQIPFFSISIGYWKDNKPVCAVVFDPLKHDLFYARKGIGAFRNGRKIKISDSGVRNHPLLASDWGHEPCYYQKNILTIESLLKKRLYLFRFLGCASLAICYVGAGILDGYWHYKLSPWDLAAGMLIAQEAGVSVTTINGEPFNLWKKDILAIKPGLKNEVLPVFNNISL